MKTQTLVNVVVTCLLHLFILICTTANINSDTVTNNTIRNPIPPELIHYVSKFNNAIDDDSDSSVSSCSTLHSNTSDAVSSL